MLTDFTVVRHSVTWKGRRGQRWIGRKKNKTESVRAALGHCCIPRLPCMREELSKCFGGMFFDYVF